MYGLELPYCVVELEPGRSWAMAGITLAAVLQPYCNPNVTGRYTADKQDLARAII